MQGCLARCVFVRSYFFASLLIDDFHRQAYFAAFIKAQQLDPDLLAFLDHVGGLGDAFGGQLRDVHQAVLGAKEVHEGAEIGNLDDGSLIDHADFRLGDDRVDPLLGGLDFLARGRGDLDGAVIVDVDLGEDELARILAGEPLEDGPQVLARAAPGRPEIDHDGNLMGTIDDGGDEIRVDDIDDESGW